MWWTGVPVSQTHFGGISYFHLQGSMNRGCDRVLCNTANFLPLFYHEEGAAGSCRLQNFTTQNTVSSYSPLGEPWISHKPSYLCVMTFFNKLMDIVLSKMSLAMFISCKNESFRFCLANSHKPRLYTLQLLQKIIKLWTLKWQMKWINHICAWGRRRHVEISET